MKIEIEIEFGNRIARRNMEQLLRIQEVRSQKLEVRS